jgi:hypothetical protein
MRNLSCRNRFNAQIKQHKTENKDKNYPIKHQLLLFDNHSHLNNYLSCDNHSIVLLRTFERFLIQWH